jgi:hypothetical protein
MKKVERSPQGKAPKKSELTRLIHRKNSGPQTLDEYRAKSDRFRDTWKRAEHVVSKMRNNGVSLHQASREFLISPRQVIRWAGSALRKRSNGRYAAKTRDRLLRVLVVPTSEGLREIAVSDSHQASQLAEYWAAVQKYLETGDASTLGKIRRKTITDAAGKRVRLIKDLPELERLGSAGVLSFESLYAKAA